MSYVFSEKSIFRKKYIFESFYIKNQLKCAKSGGEYRLYKYYIEMKGIPYGTEAYDFSACGK
jgi:hypothetical protein